MRVIMPVIIDRLGRNFNADETDGVSGRDKCHTTSGCNASFAALIVPD
jgi:hypothetical protein